LVTVSVNGGLATPGCCTPKFKLAGLTLNAGGSKPVPDRATVCVCSASLTVSQPVWVPAAVGAKYTLIAQLEFEEFAASWPLQLSDSVNGPLIVNVIPVNGRSQVLARLTVCASES